MHDTSARVQRLLAAVAIGIAVLGTAAALRLVHEAGERAGGEALSRAVQAGEARLGEALTAELGAVEMLAHNAGTNPRLVAALQGNVSRETLRDLFQTESWWQPFREAFETCLLARTEETLDFISGPGTLELDGRALARRARRERRAVAELAHAAGAVRVLVGVPVQLPGQVVPPVLLLARPLDAATLGRIADRVGGAVLVADRTRPLLAAGSAADLAVLRTLEAREGVARMTPAPGLTLATYVSPAGARAPLASKASVRKLAIACAGLALLVGGLLLRRRSRPQVAPAVAAAPSSVGRYVLLERLGGGGMAEIYLAVSLGESGFRRACVVKRLRPELATNPLAVAQFTDEATVASSLVHSNIVPIYDFCKLSGQHFLVQEYIAGRDLGRLVRKLASLRRLPVPSDVLAFVACETLKALEYAHGRREHDGRPSAIVHRDVSPENVMVSLGGEVKLLDFGVLKAEGQRTKTDVGAVKGNVAFMSPEQARGKDVDARTDLFSLGLVLYHCLRGRPLYPADKPGYELLVKAGAGPDADDLRALAALPFPFSFVLRKALAPRLEDRYRTAAEMIADLQPHVGDGAAHLAALMTELFADELHAEQQVLATTSSAVTPGHARGPAPYVVAPAPHSGPLN